MRTDALDYDLPEELIAQQPAAERDSSRLLHVDARSGILAERRFSEIAMLLPPALFVVNDTRVIPARLLGTRPSGGAVELLLLERIAAASPSEETWLCLGKTSKGLRVGMQAKFGALSAEIVEKRDEGVVLARLNADDVARAIEDFGRLPLPPYVTRDVTDEDKIRYQTVFAKHSGAVAAPTASLHFTEALLQRFRAAGHEFAAVTLHVGIGTFRPVKCDFLQEHKMHSERFAISVETAERIREARAVGRPVVAVGTTVARTLEAAASEGGLVQAGEGRTDIFIYPPYRPKVVDHLVTNFHLPRSTLLAMVFAFGGEELVRRAYASAVASRFRFFSYGDAMLLSGIRSW